MLELDITFSTAAHKTAQLHGGWAVAGNASAAVEGPQRHMAWVGSQHGRTASRSAQSTCERSGSVSTLRCAALRPLWSRRNAWA